MKVVKISKKHGRDAYHVTVEVTKAELDKQFPDPLEWGTVSKPYYPKVLTAEEIDALLESTTFAHSTKSAASATA